METLLDHHLATFDIWLQAHFMSLIASSRPHYYLTVVTLLDQLDPKEFNWEQVSVILRHQLSFIPPDKFFHQFDGKTLNLAFTRIVSEFLVDRDRARSLWVDSNKLYADLVTYILGILRDK
jgi:hypothetical protein